MIKIKRVYSSPSEEDGERILVDRLWPRGIKKEDIHMKAWLKDVAPSTDLRKWFHHDPSKWEEFKKKYYEQLDHNPSAWEPILDAARKHTITLLYAAKDTEHNEAQALAEYLSSKEL